MRQIAIIAALVVAGAGVIWQFPLFHVVRLSDAAQRPSDSTFDATQFAAQLWEDRLIPTLADATDAWALATAMQQDADGARRQFGRTVGVSRTTYYYVRGEGVVASVTADETTVTLHRNGAACDVALQTGFLFGSAVRDATGLVDPEDFANSQHFNDLSAALNRRVESQVIPDVKQQAEVGKNIRFVGCAEMATADQPPPLRVVPVHVEFD